MSDPAVGQLVSMITHPSVHSLVLVPEERPACLHIDSTRGGWVVTLSCRRMLSVLLRAVVVNSGLGLFEAVRHAHNVDRVTITTASPALLRRLITVMVADHERTAPGRRLAAVALGRDAASPRRVEVVPPGRFRPAPAAGRRVLSLSGALSHA